MEVELDLLKFATKPDLKKSKFSKNVYLPSLKSDVDKLDIDKLEKIPPCLNDLKGKIVKIDVNTRVSLHLLLWFK